MNGNQSTSYTRATDSHKPLLAQLGFLVTAVFFNVFSRMLFSPLLPAMVRDLGISHARAGSFFVYISVGYATSMLLSGFVSQRITHRWTISIALFTAGFALSLIALSPSAAYMPAGFLVLGFGTGLYPPSGITTLTNIVKADRWGRATAIHELGPNAAFVIAPFAASLAILLADWRAALWGTAAACGASGVAFLLWGKGGRFAGVPPHLSKIIILLRSRTFLVVFLFFLVAMSGFLGVYAMLPSYLVAERDMAQALVNNVVGLSRVSGLFMIFLVGSLVDRVHAGRLLASIVTVVGLSTIGIGTFEGTWLMICIVIEAMLAAALIPVMLTVLSRVSPTELRSLAIAVTIPFAYVGGAGLVPYLLGLMAEHATFAAGFVILGALLVASAVASRVIPGGHD